MQKGYTKTPHLTSVRCLTINEKMMLWTILDAENRFQRNWVGIGTLDWFDVGFGQNGNTIRETRSSLIEKGLIEYRQGRKGVLSQYRVVEDLEDRVSDLEERAEELIQPTTYDKPIEEPKVEEPKVEEKKKDRFDNIDDAIEYLVYIHKTKNKDARYREQNSISNKYGFDFFALENGVNEKVYRV